MNVGDCGVPRVAFSHAFVVVRFDATGWIEMPPHRVGANIALRHVAVLAAFIEQVGPPETMRYGQLPTPQRGPTDVLVDVLYTTVNSVDTLIRSGVYHVPMAFPFVIGRDMVGRVAAVGWGSPEFRVGDVVWCNSLGHGGRQGASAEQAVVPADRLYHLADGVRPDDAVTVLHPAATAYLALFTHGRRVVLDVT